MRACVPWGLGSVLIGWQIAGVGSAGPPIAPPVFLALLTPRGSWWVSVFLLLPASYLLTWIAGHLVPLPLSPQAPCLQSPLSSHLCPLSLVLSLQPPAPLEFTFTIHLACPALAPSAYGSRSPSPPPLHLLWFLTAFSSCFHLFPARVLLGLLSWFSPSTPSHQLVLSLGHFFPAPLSQCTGALVTHPSVCCEVSSLGALLGPSVWSLPHPLFPEVSGPERCCRTC